MTEIGKEPVVKHVVRISKEGGEELFVKTEKVEPYIDDFGHSGDDSQVTLHLIDDYGKVRGTINYSTDTGEYRDFSGAAGCFSTGNMKEINKIIGLFEEMESGESVIPEDPKINYELPEDIDVDNFLCHLKYAYDSKRAIQIKGYPGQLSAFPLFFTEDGGNTWIKSGVVPFCDEYNDSWKPNNANGFLLVAIGAIADPIDRVDGGLYKSMDFGKTWTSVPFLDNQYSFTGVVGAQVDFDTFAVVVDEKNANNHGVLSDKSLLPSVWITWDGGKSWELLENDENPLDSKQIKLISVSAASGHTIALLSGQLAIYRERSLIDRFLRRFDDL